MTLNCCYLDVGIDRVSKGKEALVGLKKELQCCNNFLGNRPPKRQFCQKCKVKQSGTPFVKDIIIIILIKSSSFASGLARTYVVRH